MVRRDGCWEFNADDRVPLEESLQILDKAHKDLEAKKSTVSISRWQYEQLRELHYVTCGLLDSWTEDEYREKARKELETLVSRLQVSLHEGEHREHIRNRCSGFAGGVYFINSAREGLTKIGQSRSLVDRTLEIIRGERYRAMIVHLIHTHPDHVRNAEAWFHEAFAKNRVSGEWYDISDAEANWAKRVKRWPEDIHSLRNDREWMQGPQRWAQTRA